MPSSERRRSSLAASARQSQSSLDSHAENEATSGGASAAAGPPAPRARRAGRGGGPAERRGRSPRGRFGGPKGSSAARAGGVPASHSPAAIASAARGAGGAGAVSPRQHRDERARRGRERPGAGGRTPRAGRAAGRAPGTAWPAGRGPRYVPPMRVVSVQTGKIAPVPGPGGALRSGIGKTARPEGVRLGPLGFEGDEIADARHHGGPERALLFVSTEALRVVSGLLHRELSPGSLGENVTVEGPTDADVCIGDVWEVGAAEVEVTSPRGPCSTLARHLAMPDAVACVSSPAACRLVRARAARGDDPPRRRAPPRRAPESRRGPSRGPSW